MKMVKESKNSFDRMLSKLSNADSHEVILTEEYWSKETLNK